MWILHYNNQNGFEKRHLLSRKCIDSRHKIQTTTQVEEPGMLCIPVNQEPEESNTTIMSVNNGQNARTWTASTKQKGIYKHKIAFIWKAVTTQDHLMVRFKISSILIWWLVYYCFQYYANLATKKITYSIYCIIQSNWM